MVAALVALLHMAAEGSGAASLNGVHDPALGVRERIA